MLLKATTTQGLFPVLRAVRALPAGVPREASWRRPLNFGRDRRCNDPVLASRWLDVDTKRRRYAAGNPADRHVIGVALRRCRARITCGSAEIFDGLMGPGMVYVTRPGEVVEAEVQGPCDFVHLYVADHLVKRIEASDGNRRLSTTVLRDDIAGYLARTLAEDAHCGDPDYAESVARTLLLRIALLSTSPNEVGALPKWRLLRVQEYVEGNLEGPISLADLAEVAGLSCSYFAAQFRTATGSRPHEYVTEQRIDRAKTMLSREGTSIVEIALSVGFQTQAHFSTVFKKLVGTSPARWRAAQRNRC